jgi:hypothetical protein
VSDDSDTTMLLGVKDLGVNELPLSPTNEWFLQLLKTTKKTSSEGVLPLYFDKSIKWTTIGELK